MWEMTPIERTAMVTYWLSRGDALSSKKIAELTDCQTDTARRLLNKLSRVLPLAEDDNGTFVLISSQR